MYEEEVKCRLDLCRIEGSTVTFPQYCVLRFLDSVGL